MDDSTGQQRAEPEALRLDGQLGDRRGVLRDVRGPPFDVQVEREILVDLQRIGAVHTEVRAQLTEPGFHEPWERRAAVVTFGVFLTGTSNGGQFRHSIERMDPSHYLGSSYYEHWATGIATRMVELGLVTVDELEARAGGTFLLS